MTDYHSNIRTAVAALLTEHPAAITPILAAIGDAIKEHDPRPRANIKDTPHTPPADAA